jgi:hypothetical protein
MSNGFDVTKAAELLKAEDEGVTIQLVDAIDEPVYYDKDGERHPVTVTVVGSYSQRFRDMEARQMRRMSKVRNQRALADAAQRFTQERVAACVLAWDGIEDNGKPLPCTFDNVMMVFDRIPFLYQQVSAAVMDHENFFKSSSPT